RNLHGDDPAYYRLPEQRELAAQYLLLYEMSLPYGLDLNDQIDVDKSATRLTVACGDIDFRALKSLKDGAEAWLRRNAPPAMHAEASSPAVMFAYIGERNILSMARGTMMSFALIAVVLVLTLRHLRLGLLSLVPNVVPITMTFGLWQLFVGEVDFAASVVASVSLGIIDDNTVHLLTDYLRGRREHGLAPADAIRYAFSAVGSAMWANSAILIFGFGALAFSAFWPNATLGMLTALAIAMAIATDFLLVPPLLLWLDRQPGGGEGEADRDALQRAEAADSAPSAPPPPFPNFPKGAAPQARGISGDRGRVCQATRGRRLLWPARRAGATALGFWPARRAGATALGVALLTAAASASAESAEEKGLRLSQEAHQRDAGYGSWSAELTMMLTNPQGESSERKLHMRGLENPAPNDGDKTLVVFDVPPDIKGTALLSHIHILEPDDQWLYLPALARVKRISSSNKSGPFVGSEFAYEDFTAQEVAKYKYKWLRDEACGELPCWVIERYPQYAHSGYTRQIVWLDQAEYRPQRVEFYDRKDEPLKTLQLEGYRRYLDKHWRADRLTMRNQQNGKGTVLAWSNYRFGLNLTEEDFTETALRRSR
ncbi:MAG TPA: outer membrane lipoprotein-sorting protein, partial [Terriglobales bacterium]|nr:outer membrane lipoprotein-sorting protein [Terriglobales bacterium]